MLETRRALPQHALSSVTRDVIDNQLDILDSVLNHKDEHLTVGGIDQQLRAIESFETTVNNHTSSLKLKLSRGRNRMLPVHYLPRELFIHILLQTKQTSSDLDTRTVASWTTVCSIWRDVIISAPILWRRVDLADGSILDLALSRNASLPLEIHWLEPRPPSYRNVSPYVHESYQLLAHRCRDLYIYTPIGCDFFTGLFELYGAYATSIDLSARRALLTVPLPEGPNLDSLALRFVSFPSVSWSSSRLVGLRSLFLQEFNRVGLSDAQFYNVLASSPRLSTLVLDVILEDRLGAGRQDINPVAPPLILPHLHLLYMGRIPTRLTRLVTAKVRCPNCKILQIWDLPVSDIISEIPLVQSLSPSSWASCELTADLSIGMISLESPVVGLASWPLEYSLTTKSPKNLLLNVAPVDIENKASWQSAVATLSGWIPCIHYLTVSVRGPGLKTLFENGHILPQARSVHLHGSGSSLLQAVHLLGEQRSRTTSEDTSDTSFLLPYFRTSTSIIWPRKNLWVSLRTR